MSIMLSIYRDLFVLHESRLYYQQINSILERLHLVVIRKNELKSQCSKIQSTIKSNELCYYTLNWPAMCGTGRQYLILLSWQQVTTILLLWIPIHVWVNNLTCHDIKKPEWDYWEQFANIAL